MEKFKTHAVSFAQTFIATFFTILGASVFALTSEQLTNPETYKTGSIVALVFAAARSALKVVWEKYFPVAIGGRK